MRKWDTCQDYATKKKSATIIFSLHKKMLRKNCINQQMFHDQILHDSVKQATYDR